MSYHFRSISTAQQDAERAKYIVIGAIQEKQNNHYKGQGRSRVCLPYW